MKAYLAHNKQGRRSLSLRTYTLSVMLLCNEVDGASLQ